MLDLSLKGKRALICGSSQGIGLAIAMELADLGADCVLLARNLSSLKEAVQKLDQSKGQSHHILVADFRFPDQVISVVKEFLPGKPIHILVNNTGGPPPGPVILASAQDLLDAYQQHLICNHLLAQLVIPAMKEAGYGRIINIISTSVKIPIKNLGVSNTTRGAVASWAKTLANEVGKDNITVNNILPGFIETVRLQSLISQIAQSEKKEESAVRKIMTREIPLGRIGKPSEIAALAAFLASPAASYISGASIPVDGGRTGSI